jgi:hypothetical protein
MKITQIDKLFSGQQRLIDFFVFNPEFAGVEQVPDCSHLFRVFTCSEKKYRLTHPFFPEQAERCHGFGNVKDEPQKNISMQNSRIRIYKFYENRMFEYPKNFAIL